MILTLILENSLYLKLKRYGASFQRIFVDGELSLDIIFLYFSIYYFDLFIPLALDEIGIFFSVIAHMLTSI